MNSLYGPIGRTGSYASVEEWVEINALHNIANSVMILSGSIDFNRFRVALDSADYALRASGGRGIRPSDLPGLVGVACARFRATLGEVGYPPSFPTALPGYV